MASGPYKARVWPASPLATWQTAERAEEQKPPLATRDRGGSGSGGHHRAQAARFRPHPPSYVLRRRRSGVGAKISKLPELDEGAAVGGEAGVGHGGAAPGGGAAHAAGQDGTAAGAGQNGAAAGAGQAGLGADQDALEKTSKSTP